jgi:hypothetical protein
MRRSILLIKPLMVPPAQTQEFVLDGLHVRHEVIHLLDVLDGEPFVLGPSRFRNNRILPPMVYLTPRFPFTIVVPVVSGNVPPFVPWSNPIVPQFLVKL